jgi:hypothetical protein
MFGRIFPKTIDNTYRGHWLGLWLFVPMVLLRATQGVNAIFITRTVITGADAIPLDSFGASAAETLVSIFALLGVLLLILPLLSLIALIRYRAMIPLLYLLFLGWQLAGRALLLYYPIVRTTEYPIGFYFNLALLGVTAIGFVLSVVGKPQAVPQKAAV